jgi:cellulose synthase/poly-beta-1,6-N-acetylglucosamine synthase-like glycosyltransferase
MKGLSICIPVHNYNCIDTVKELLEQASDLSYDIEIKVIDDGSSITFDDLKFDIDSRYTYDELDSNIGRSKIRNLLAQRSNFDHILFLDADSGIPVNFIRNYINAIGSDPKAIICGGREHRRNSMTGGKLRYNYGIKYEDAIAEERNKRPYNNFSSSNFVVPKSIMEKIPFNEQIVKYGHEDTLFGYQLKQQGELIIHIDNPVIHLHLESNREFIEKTVQGIENLMQIIESYPDFMEYSKLLVFINNYSIFKTDMIKKSSLTLAKFFKFLAQNTGNVYSLQLFKLFYANSIK